MAGIYRTHVNTRLVVLIVRLDYIGFLLQCLVLKYPVIIA